MDEIKAHLKARRQIYIHNDISNAVFYFKQRVDNRIAVNDRAGVGLEIIAGLTLLAFEVEARFNFFGYKLFEDWDERQPGRSKIETVCKRLDIVPDFSVRPYLSTENLRAFRNTLAHGKPEHITLDKEVVGTVEALEAMGILHAEWERYIDPGFFSDAYVDVEQIWTELLARSGLTVFETLTHGDSQMSFIEQVK